ncbi:hypothetical protein D9M70_506520 [compost metagenome]
MRGIEYLHRGQRSRIAQGGWHLGLCIGNQPHMRQVAQQCVGIVHRLLLADIVPTAQLQRGGKGWPWDRKVRELPLQSVPEGGEGLVETISLSVRASLLGGMQNSMCAGETCQDSCLLLLFAVYIKMHHGLAVTVQIDDVVSIAGQSQQRVSQGFKLGARLEGVKAFADTATDQRDIGIRIAAQGIGDLLAHQGGEIQIVAVEVLSAGQLKAP